MIERGEKIAFDLRIFLEIPSSIEKRRARDVFLSFKILIRFFREFLKSIIFFRIIRLVSVRNLVMFFV